MTSYGPNPIVRITFASPWHGATCLPPWTEEVEFYLWNPVLGARESGRYSPLCEIVLLCFCIRYTRALEWDSFTNHTIQRALRSNLADWKRSSDQEISIEFAFVSCWVLELALSLIIALFCATSNFGFNFGIFQLNWRRKSWHAIIYGTHLLLYHTSTEFSILQGNHIRGNHWLPPPIKKWK